MPRYESPEIYKALTDWPLEEIEEMKVIANSCREIIKLYGEKGEEKIEKEMNYTKVLFSNGDEEYFFWIRILLLISLL